MQFHPDQTTVNATAEEVALHTLASDIASLERGNPAPLPEQLTAQLVKNSSGEETASTEPRASHWGIVLTILIVLAVAAVLYFIAYPMLIGTSSVIGL